MGVDPFLPNPVYLVNYLAYGVSQINWKASTCATYRSALLDLYTNPTVITQDPTYREFFTALNEKNILSFYRPIFDITPVILFLHNLGPNDQLTPMALTRKLCWLLAVCGFLRPADLERVDDARTSVEQSILRLVIVAPKEKHSGRRIERVVAIQPHDDSLLCPVVAYQAYKSRIARAPCVRPHPVLADVTIHRLACPNARALGPTLALAPGASVDDILVHVSWASSSVFDTFYRLSRQTVGNFSAIALSSSRGPLESQPESLSNEE
ncbi:hypothetical protein CLU79DRAFT_716201 [Phycomyces nitens]|nr:hypothetical protein CLU79DRAFT_716201 [Phycomyces nitens]